MTNRCHRRPEGERGAVLVMTLLVLVVLSLLGSASLITSSTEVDIAGNETQYQRAFYVADGGAELAPEVIRDLVGSYDDPDYASESVDVAPLRNELLTLTRDTGDSPTATPDISLADTPETVPDIPLPALASYLSAGIDIDVDPSKPVGYLVGGGVEQASGYEGIGVGTAKGGAARFYLVESESRGPRNAAALVQTRYRYVIGTPGGS